MIHIDLKKYSGLALSYGESKLIPNESGVSIVSQKTVNISDVRPQLLNSDLTCPLVFYYLYSGLDTRSLLKRKNLKYCMYVIPSNLAGIEYVKTLGQCIGNYPLLVESVRGFVTIIFQLSKIDADGLEYTEAYVVRLRRGQKYVLPPKSQFVMINTHQSTAIVAVVHSRKVRISRACDDTHGVAIYIIRKNARREIVQNPSYREVKMFRPCKHSKLYKHFKLTEKTPVFKQILRKYQRFKWLHDASEIDWENIFEKIV
ncbi:MAG: glucose-6-phosphate isomerase family protein [Patescibacteria group bacterium]|nr:glucose-6-phosphate isomerase family protein [Patescibacteria group bacterium]